MEKTKPNLYQNMCFPPSQGINEFSRSYDRNALFLRNEEKFKSWPERAQTEGFQPLFPLPQTSGAKLDDLSEASSRLMLEESKSDSLSKESHSRDSLKFGRRVAKIFTEHLCLAKHESFATPFLKASSKVLNSILAAVYGPNDSCQISSDVLIRIQSLILQKVWEEFKALLSYHKNKKICIVKAEYWDVVFCRKTFGKNARKVFESLNHVGTSLKLISQDEGVLGCFSDILFSINKLMVLLFTLKDSTVDGGLYLRKLPILDNLILLVMDSKLFEYYNHRSGKFANECCGKCKVCRSRSVPEDLADMVEKAKRNTGILIEAMANFCPYGLKLLSEEQIMYLLCLVIQL